jgi:hypothetical protein
MLLKLLRWQQRCSSKEITRANISLLAIRVVLFRGPYGIFSCGYQAAEIVFISREAARTSSSVATRDLVFRCRAGERGARASRLFSEGGELWIFVVKLLRAHGGCLGVKRR